MSRILLATTVVVSLSALYGFSVASDPATYRPVMPTVVATVPSEDDYRRVPDPAHNQRIFLLRDALAERGFLVNGSDSLSPQSLAVLRGTYGLMSPGDTCDRFEWRLMATRAVTCQPSSFVRLHRRDGRFMPDMAVSLADEWRSGGECLPSEVLDGGEALLAQLAALWQADQPQAEPHDPATIEACIVERQWVRGPQARARYQLRIGQRVGDYQLQAELFDRPEHIGDPATCDVLLNFTWLGQQRQQLASSK